MVRARQAERAARGQPYVETSSPDYEEHSGTRAPDAGWVTLGLPSKERFLCEYDVHESATTGTPEPLAQRAGVAEGPTWWYAIAACRGEPRELILVAHGGSATVKNLSPDTRRMPFGVSPNRQPDPSAQTDRDYRCTSATTYEPVDR